MILDMMNLEEQALPNFKGGEGVTYARMHVDGLNRIMLVRLPYGASIGMHTHETSSEIIHILAGKARIIMDGAEEIALPGQVHYCPKGHTHTTISAGDEDLLMLAVVPEQ